MVAKVLVLLEHTEDMIIICDSLEHFGHGVYKAFKFQDAMEILRQRPVDLIIGDVHLQNGGSIFDKCIGIRHFSNVLSLANK